MSFKNLIKATLEMILELEGESPNWKAINESLNVTGAQYIEELYVNRQERPTNFSGSGMQITRHRWSDAPRMRPSAPGDHGCHFPVFWFLNFRIVNGIFCKKCVDDIYGFLRELTRQSSTRFVLSCPREGVRALRGESLEFEWRWDRP